MQYTLSDCLYSINQILNYPSLSYEDVSAFFDQAISELNTELHIGLKPISEIYRNTKNRFNAKVTDSIVLTSPPASEIPVNTYSGLVYFSPVNHKIYYRQNTTEDFKATDRLIGVYPTVVNNAIVNETYETVILGDFAYWYPCKIVPEDDIKLTDYLPTDWIILFVIPYICFKFAIRDGRISASYAEDLSNGFAQLRKSYDVPCFVNLAEQAGKEAYAQEVEENLPNINIIIPTRAIYEDMKVGRSFTSKHIDSMYDRGGWRFDY